jgi:predicted membrane protein
MNMEFESHPRIVSSPRLVLGIGVIILGLFLTLDQIPILRDSRAMEFLIDLWPLILVAMGVTKIKQSTSSNNTGGYTLVIVGLFLLLITLGHGHFAELIWPAILVAAGISIVLNALKQHRRVPPELQRSQDFSQGTAILSGFKHRVMSQAFKGGELTAIFGGFELDLRQAAIEGNSAQLDLFILFGGGEIRVPEGWDVVVQVTAIAAGVDNKAATLPLEDGTRPKLVITGTMLFGGAEIKR